MEVEPVIGQYDKTILNVQSQRDKLDCHVCFSTIKGICTDRDIRISVFPFDEEWKNTVEPTFSNNEKYFVSYEYFISSDKTFLHYIGVVSFYMIEKFSSIECIRSLHCYPPYIVYYYKPIPTIPYMPAPLFYEAGEWAYHQKLEKRKISTYRKNCLFAYIRDNETMNWDIGYIIFLMNKKVEEDLDYYVGQAEIVEYPYGFKPSMSALVNQDVKHYVDSMARLNPMEL
jgi:hypothetical protein